MKDLFEKITAEIETFNTESELHIEKGNKAAGTRARKSSLELEKKEIIHFYDAKIVDTI